MRVTIEVVVSDQFIEDLLTTAAEGGIGYWATLVWWDVASHMPRYTGCYIVDRGDERTPEPDAAWMVADREAVERGLALVLAGKAKVHSSYVGMVAQALRNQEDGCELDAEGADIVVQAALFGEVVYG
jgi:hypothetical protein